MGAEEIGFAERGEDREVRFRAADFVAEIFEGVRKGVAHRIAKRAEAEGVEESFHLVLDAHGAVLEVAVVKAQAGVDEDFFDAEVAGHFDLAFEVGTHGGNGIVAQFEVADFANVFSLHVTDDDGGIVFGDEGINFFDVGVAGEIEDSGAGFEAGARHSGLVRFGGDNNAGVREAADDGEELGVLKFDVGGGGVSESGFGADINDRGALRMKNKAAMNSGFGAEANAFAIP